jgi:hypothetical protein
MPPDPLIIDIVSEDGITIEGPQVKFCPGPPNFPGCCAVYMLVGQKFQNQHTYYKGLVFLHK